MTIADLRKDYKLASLSEADVDADPLKQFDKWLKEVITAELPEPTAMSVATVSGTMAGQMHPTTRIVLLKGFDSQGFVFFTNYASRKGVGIAANPFACLLFHWVELERQVRIEGRIDKVSEEESEAYFNTRPIESRLGAWASPQSHVIPDREWLEKKLAAVAEQYHGDPPRPPHWGGYRLTPNWFEFWQGRSNRLHDRIQYRLDANRGWIIERLAP
jgi:pyridoxamine 5'-phosphate oxidase